MEARESYYMKNISKYKLIFKSGLFVVFMSLETFVSEKSLWLSWKYFIVKVVTTFQQSQTTETWITFSQA